MTKAERELLEATVAALMSLQGHNRVTDKRLMAALMKYEYERKHSVVGKPGECLEDA